jgi:tetrahydrodipicolinate N-succinyltransferase
MSALVTENEQKSRLPEPKTLQNAAQLGIVEDRPIMLDYWNDSISKTVMIGIRDDGKKMLIKNSEEYTSYIEKVYRIQNKDSNVTDYIIMTENSIYIVDGAIPSKKVSFEN